MDDRLRPHAESLVVEADAAAAIGDWDSVRRLASAALALAPEDADARRHLEVAERALGGAGERRQLTVMFCDVVGSTALADTTDPEVLAEVIHSYRKVLDRVVAQADGSIAVWIGDGALVYFGHPTPHEDDAWRGVHAGLALLNELEPAIHQAWQRHRVDLAVRVAVHTGLVVRAELGTSLNPDRNAIVGATPNLAARLQDKARPGTLVISEATHDLVRGRFAVVPVGPFRLKGFSHPVGAYAVEFEVAQARTVETVGHHAPLVARQAELDQLTSRWREVAAGSFAAAMVVGDPGIGKTRLAAEIRQLALDDGGRVLEGGCAEFQSAVPLHPVRQVVERALSFDPRQRSVRRERLVAALDRVGEADAAGAVLGQLGYEEPAPGDVAQQRATALAALARWLADIAARQPVLLVVDDVQWIDPTSRDLLSTILAKQPPGLFLLLVARSAARSSWTEAAMPQIVVGPLADADARSLVDELADGELDAELVAEVVARADGVPLFLEELVRAATASGGAGGRGDVPTGLRDLLLARLAASGGDFTLAQLVATIGDRAPSDLLRAVGGWSPAQLEDLLRGPLSTGVLLRDADDAVRFRHHLLGQLAYETQLHRVRQERHAAIALVLAEQDDAVDRTAKLAHHLEHAGQPAAAAEQLLRAGREAQRLGAQAEAMAQLDKALSLLPAVPDESQRLGIELLVREARHFSWATALTSGSPDAASDFERCLHLLLTLPPRPEHDAAFVSMFGHLLMTGRQHDAEALNEAGRLRFADYGVDDIAMPIEAGRCLTSFFRGDLHRCIEDGNAFLRSPSGQWDSGVPEGYPLPNELVTTIGSTLGAALALAGDVEASRAVFERVDDRVARLADPYRNYSTSWACSMAALAWFNLRDESSFRAAIGRIRELTVLKGMEAYMLVSAIQDAMAAVRWGDAADGEHMATMLEVWRITGSDNWLPCFGLLAVEGHARGGDLERAVATATDLLELAAHLDVHYFDAPLLRARGDLRLALGDDAGVDDLAAAAAQAADRGARLFELEARASLVRATDEPKDLKELAELADRFPAHVAFEALDDARAIVAARRGAA